jgi:hypothetical protein
MSRGLLKAATEACPVVSAPPESAVTEYSPRTGRDYLNPTGKGPSNERTGGWWWRS